MSEHADHQAEARDERVLASDVVKYLRLRAEAERFRLSRPRLNEKLTRLLKEDNAGQELAFLNWDIPTL